MFTTILATFLLTMLASACYYERQINRLELELDEANDELTKLKGPTTSVLLQRRRETEANLRRQFPEAHDILDGQPPFNMLVPLRRVDTKL